MTIQPASAWGTAPGFFANVPPGDYHALREFDGDPVTSQTTLSHLKDCPAKCKHFMDHGMEETPSMRSGTMLHAANLEPMEYAMRYCRAGTCSGTTQQGRKCSRTGQVRIGGSWWCHDHTPEGEPDDIIRVTPAEEEKIAGVKAFLASYKPAKAIFAQPGGFEVSMLWRHEGSGLWIRSRVDFLSLHARIGLDYKKTRDASKPGFQKSVERYGYHRQGVLYDLGFRALGADDMHFVFLAQEEASPYIAAARRLTSGGYEIGRRELEDGYVDGNGDYVPKGLLYRFAECARTGEWPGYEEVIGDVGVSAWYEKNLIEAEVATI